jgi:hypothetical protein
LQVNAFGLHLQFASKYIQTSNYFHAMIKEVPFYISLLFMLTTFLSVYIFWLAAGKSRVVLIISAAWLLLQAIVGYSGFYTNYSGVPPRFVLLVLPPLLFIIILFLSKKGRVFLDGLDQSRLTLLHSVRIPVELSLLALFIYGAVPELMTFEGRNPDILSGITALFIFYFGYVKKNLSRPILIAWNLICLGLLVNIVTYAILSAPFEFQKMAFDQPNVGVLYFPFVWLPCCVVPLVLLSHLASLRQLFRSRTYEIPDLLDMR